MNYAEGIIFIKQLFFLYSNSNSEKNKINKSNLYNGLVRLEIPGYKSQGDYKVWYRKSDKENYIAPSHVDVVVFLYRNATTNNVDEIINFLECLFLNGLHCTNKLFGNNIKELIFWLTLQEDLNYPMSANKQGRKLTYQRYFEALLAKLGYCELSIVQERTNNHNKSVPHLLVVPENIKTPIFYSLTNKFQI